MAVASRRGCVWQPEEVEHAIDLVERHTHLGRVAYLLGRTRHGIEWKVKEHGVVPLRANDARTVQGVANLFGVHHLTVVRWIARGRLRATAMGFGNHIRLIAWADLDRFLRDELSWPLWDPTQITDPDLRAHATEMRQGVRFVSPREAGRVLGLSSGAVGTRCRDGRLQSVVVAGCYRIRTDWLRAYQDDLAREVRAPIILRRFAPDDLAFMRTWRPYQPLYALADALGFSATGVREACKRLGVVGPSTPTINWRNGLRLRRDPLDGESPVGVASRESVKPEGGSVD